MRRRRDVAQQERGSEKEPGREAEGRQPQERADHTRGEVVSLLLDHAREYMFVILTAAARLVNFGHSWQRRSRLTFFRGRRRGIAFSVASTNGRNTSSRGLPSWSCSFT